MTPSSSKPLIEMHDIRKSFGANDVLLGINFDVRPGEVHALLGENGAGKSTLMKILMGVHRQDGGEILIEGRPATGDTAGRLAAGVAMIFQELSLVPAMTVADNIWLGREPVGRAGWIDRRRIRADAAALIAARGFDIDPAARVETLPFAARQQVEILKALGTGAQVVVMDEPTSSLTQREEQVLHGIVRRLRDQGLGIIFISHRMNEIFRLSDRLSVLKDGRMMGTLSTAETSPEAVNRLLMRTPVTAHAPVASARSESGRIVLEVAGLSTRRKLRDVYFKLAEGEVLGLAGLVGSGRTVLAQALFGLLRDTRGTVKLGDIDFAGRGIADRISAGIAMVPEDRRHQGLVLAHGLADNIALPGLAAKLRGALRPVSRRGTRSGFDHWRKALSIACRGPRQEAGELSGGNQQKIVFAKWLATGPRLLILDEPTAGVDVNAKAEMRKLVRQAADSGLAVLLITSELDELAELSDRVAYMAGGRLIERSDPVRGEEDIRHVLQDLSQETTAA